MVSLGFIGAGAITDAVVQGLHAAGNAGHEIHLSPRSEARSRALAARYERVIREDSNAAVVAKSDIVFLAVRPQQMRELVGLRFRAEQTVVSFLAGTPIDQLRPFVAPAARLVRVVPLPCIRLRQGPIPDDAVRSDGRGSVRQTRGPHRSDRRSQLRIRLGNYGVDVVSFRASERRARLVEDARRFPTRRLRSTSAPFLLDSVLSEWPSAAQDNRSMWRTTRPAAV